MNKNFSFSEVFSLAWQTFKANWAFMLGSYVIIFAASGLFSYLSDVVYRDIQPTGGLLGLIGMALRLWLNFNFLVVTIGILNGVKPEWRDLFIWRAETLRYVGASLLYGFVIFLGFLCLVIPGFYLAIKYQFYGMLIADKKMGVIESFKASGQMTEGVKWLLIGFSFACMGIALLGVLALGVGLLVALPVISFALLVVYRSLYDQTTFETAPVVVVTPVAAETPVVPVVEVTPETKVEAVKEAEVIEKVEEKKEEPKV